MKTSIELDEELLDEAMHLTGAKTKREVVHLALRELVARRRRSDLAELAGRIRFRADFDHKRMRDL